MILNFQQSFGIVYLLVTLSSRKLEAKSVKNEKAEEEEKKIREFVLNHGLWTPDPLLLLGPPEQSDTEEGEIQLGNRKIYIPKSEASFVTPNNTRVTVEVGNQATLRCQIKNLSPAEAVMWVRRRDHHLISLGGTIYTADDRFYLKHSPERQEWTLHLKFPQKKDSGLYECQVAAHPPIGILTTLNVIQPVSLIRSHPDLYAQAESDVTLTCVLKNFTVPPKFVFWYHDKQMINYDNNRNIKITNRGGESTLHLTNVKSNDSGRYICSPSSAEASSINLHVLPGGDPAAIKRSKGSSFKLLWRGCWSRFASLFIFIQLSLKIHLLFIC